MHVTNKISFDLSCQLLQVMFQSCNLLETASVMARCLKYPFPIVLCDCTLNVILCSRKRGAIVGVVAARALTSATAKMGRRVRRRNAAAVTNAGAVVPVAGNMLDATEDAGAPCTYCSLFQTVHIIFFPKHYTADSNNQLIIKLGSF